MPHPSGTTGARIVLEAGDGTFTTPVNTGGAWRSVTGPTLSLKKGTHTIRVSGGGWFLSWLGVTRRSN